MRMPPSLLSWLGLLCLPALAAAQAPSPIAKTPEPAPAAAQAPAEGPALPKAGPDQGTPDGSTRVLDLAHRYRFAEQYTNREGEAPPGIIAAYRVTATETVKETTDEADAATRPGGTSREIEYVERPAEISGLGAVTSTIRTYNRFRSKPEEPAPAGGRLLDGLTVWYHPQRDASPLLISLEGRRLREREYELASRQIYLPGLTALLPTQSVRIGDTWRIPRKAVQALLAEPEVRGDALRGKFLELRRPPVGGGLQAVFTVTGSIQTQVAETRVNSELVFSFAPPQADRADPARKGPLVADDSLVDARGAITGLLLARVAQGTLPAPAGSKPRKFKVEQQLVLDRRLGGPGPIVRGEVPNSMPAATVANSWLTYLDPQGRFTFQHPQDLLPPGRGQASVDALFLTRGGPEGRDLIQIDLFSELRGPDALKEVLKARYAQVQAEVLSGGEEWLPAADWPGMKVFRIEAALKPSSRGPRGQRVHFDAYLIQFNDSASAIAIATTTKDAVPGFRREVEQVLRTFRPLISG
jgi:hypothetical protein